MKILQVSNFLAPVHGGSAEVPFQLSKLLAQRGHDVAIYTSNSGMDEQPQISGVNIQAFNTRFKIAGFNITPALTGKLKEEIHNFDILHLHNYRTYQNVVASRYARKTGIPYIIQAHGSLTTYFQKGYLKRLFDIFWGNKILKNASKVFAVTAVEAEQYRNMGVDADRIEIIPHGVNLAEFDPQAEKGKFRKQYQINEDQKIVLYLGRIHWMKGLDILVKAFAELYSKRKDIKLVIAGPDDEYLSKLKKLVAELKIEDGVLIAGPLYGQDKLNAYKTADVYVLPSSYEIFGITILEAWACSKAVIVTDRSGLAIVVKDKAGIVVPYDKEQLSGALTKILDNSIIRQEFGRQGRKLVEEKYNWDNVAKMVENSYEKIIARRNK